MGSSLIVRSSCIGCGHVFMYTAFNPNLPFSVKMIFNIRTLTTEYSKVCRIAIPIQKNEGKET